MKPKSTKVKTIFVIISSWNFILATCFLLKLWAGKGILFFNKINYNCEVVRFFLDLIYDFTSGILYEIGTSDDTYNATRNYDGKVNMVFAYDRELTTAEVEQNFNALKRRFGS